MRQVYRVIRNVTWGMCTGLPEMWQDMYAGLSEMWHEASTQGYHKCDIRQVFRVIRNVNEACEQFYQKCDSRCVLSYQKCDMRHVHRLIRNVTWGKCTGLSEMWHEACAHGYQKCEMCAWLSQMWHETFAHGYQKCVMGHVYKVIRNVAYMCTGL